MVKKAAAFLLSLSLIFTTGCWDYTEYEQMVLVSSMGVDYDTATKLVTVSLLYIMPSGSGSQGKGGGSSKNSTEVMAAKGFTTDEALTRLQQANSKKLFFGYLEDLVVGKDAAQNIMKNMLGTIDRTPSVRTTAYVAVTDGNASDVLSTTDYDISATTGKQIHDIIDQSINSGSGTPVSIQDFTEVMSIDGEQPVAPEITAIRSSSQGGQGSSSQGGQGSSSQGGQGSSSQGGQGSSSQGGSSSSQKSSSGSSQKTSSSQEEKNNTPWEKFYKSLSGDGSSSTSQTETKSGANDQNVGSAVKLEQKKGYFKVDGLAAFNGEKLAGRLNEQESLGLLYVLGKNVRPYENVKLGDGTEKTSLSFRISKNKSDVKVSVEDNKPLVSVDVSVESDVRKFPFVFKQELLTPDVVKILEKKLEEEIKKEIEASIKKAQKELKTDVFCFGFDLYRENPGNWHKTYSKKWEKEYPNAKVNVKVTANVINTGTTIERFKAR